SGSGSRSPARSPTRPSSSNRDRASRPKWGQTPFFSFGRNGVCPPFESVPDAVVVFLQLGGAQREAGGPPHPARLPHEGEGVLDLLRLELGRRGLVEGRAVRAVQIGRASCRERVEISEGAGSIKKNRTRQYRRHHSRRHTSN